MTTCNQVTIRRNTSTQTEESILERNISHVPVTECQILKLFNALDTKNTGFVSLSEVRNFYLELDHLGVNRSDQEVERLVSEYACTKPGYLSMTEFSCFLLKISQW